ncbi:putative GTPase MTG2 [Lachancea thermotolerans CBS 6340]|uniref:KLTH0H00660p n=1 Tax=Lachancea thermotolerans (strain ATCC 56472 / CBS 6340 / NRRL Y-8284) TaxID=559295 RepID=C5E1Y5_LACTC|nr:KLTH0H00660p [Lachancea thermotolerans CBS 6340]CAR30046.1 KLTH0H00660p [Lachancea thermotolerans CBS 6340]
MVLRRPIQRASLRVRFNSTAPDNAPKASDNEIWLRKLSNNRKLAHAPEVSQKIQPASSSQDHRNRFEIISTPPDTSFIGVKAPLSEFTSLSHIQSNNQRHAQAKKFVDVRILKCRSGQGGDGAVSFFRDAGRAIGPPDGGDGGDGGSVFVQAIEGLNSLAKLKTSYIAEDGANGAAKQLDGARGKDVLISVPVGTVVKWCLNPSAVRSFIEKFKNRGTVNLRQLLEQNKVSLQCTGRFEMDQKPSFIQLFRESYEAGEGWHFKGKDEEYHLEKNWFKQLKEKVSIYDLELASSELSADKFPLLGIDLDKPSDRPICLVKGGKGGLGNMHFLTNLIRNPRFSKMGRSGLEQFFMFELKSLADIGLVGLPNAGKSTILNKISKARPKIGHWEFTTTHPSIGTFNVGAEGFGFTVADIPGIIKDASKDKGMGLEFLRHIQRSKGWTIVVSLEREDPLADLQLLISELGGMEEVARKNVLVVCNKADIEPHNPQSLDKFLDVQGFCETQNWDIIPISALKGENIDLLIEKMARCAETSAT